MASKMLKLVVVILFILGLIFFAIYIYYPNYLTTFTSKITKNNTNLGILNPQQKTTFTTQNWSNEYVHSIYATFVSFDLTNGTMLVKGSDKNIYIFKVSNNLGLESYQNFKAELFSPVQDIVNSDHKKFTKGSKLRIFWNDARTLDQVQEDYAKNSSQPLNFSSNRYFFITKRG